MRRNLLALGSATLLMMLVCSSLAQQSERYCIVLLSTTRGDQRPLLDKIKAIREQVGLSKSELPVAEFGWDIPLHRGAIEKALGLKEHQLPLASTGELAPSGMPLAANRHRPALSLPDEVIAFYLINEWARRAGREPYFYPYLKSAAALKVSDKVVRSKDGSELVLVPGGRFWMGSTEGEIDELPPRSLELAPFFIGRSEITVGQFRRFVEETDYRTEAEENGCGFVWTDEWSRVDGANWRNPTGDGVEQGDDLPVRQVTQADAQAYATWAGVRLPSEEEWEKAARGTTGQQYPWGNQWNPNRAVFGGSMPVKVGSCPSGRSPYGLYDMAGNVREWTGSPYQPYSELLEDGKVGRRYAVRGGSWAESRPNYLRSSYRFNQLAAVSNDRTGFRVAKDYNSDLGVTGF